MTETIGGPVAAKLQLAVDGAREMLEETPQQRQIVAAAYAAEQHDMGAAGAQQVERVLDGDLELEVPGDA